ncbi:MAG: DUF3313 domain-containing protein [Planctomycetota bacterium]|jgi:hypothetical protein
MKRLLAALLLFGLVVGCAKTMQARSSEYSGFLEDYERLERGKKHEALYRWVNPDAAWSTYDRILLDPIMLYRDAEGQRDLKEDEVQEVLDYFYERLYEDLAEDYEMVRDPAPRTLRIRVVITRVNATSPAVDGVSTVIPVGLGISGVQWALTGQPTFTGDVAVEFRASDAMTTETLAEGIDRRVGGKNLGKGMSKWSDVQNAMDKWAQIMVYRLCVLSERQGCQEP